MKRIWRSFNFNIGRILAYIAVGLIITLFSSFLNSANVNASVVETKEVSSVTANGTTIFDINSGLNTYKMVATGNSTYLRYEINLLSNSPLNESYFLVTQVCSNYGWEGVTDSSNVINVNGRMTYVKTLYTNQNAGSCTVNGYSGTIVQNIYLFNSQASSSVSGSSHIMSATLTTWHGGYTTYNGFIQVLSATIQDYDSNLEQQIINNNNQSSIINQNGTIINQNQTIIDQNNQQLEEQQETNEKLDELNDNITDTDTSGSEDLAGGFFEDFDNEDYGLSDIITMPLQVINNITSATCSPLELPLPFVDTDVALPCMYDIYEDHFGGFLTIYQTITFGIVAYWVCINIFRMVKNFKNPDNDEVEVLDL